MTIDVLKIDADEQQKATGLNIVVCWYGDLETGFYYTDLSYQDQLDGEVVTIEEGSDDD